MTCAAKSPQPPTISAARHVKKAAAKSRHKVELHPPPSLLPRIGIGRISSPAARAPPRCHVSASWAYNEGTARTVSDGPYRFNLDEYMVTLNRPMGIRFASTDTGQVIAESLARHGSAERSKLVMVGDILKRFSLGPGEAMLEVDPVHTHTLNALQAGSGPVVLIFERAPHAAHTTKIMSAVPGRGSSAGKAGCAAWAQLKNRPWHRRVEQGRGGPGSVGCTTFLERASSSAVNPNGSAAIGRLATASGEVNLDMGRGRARAQAKQTETQFNALGRVETSGAVAAGRSRVHKEQGGAGENVLAQASKGEASEQSSTHSSSQGLLGAALRTLGAVFAPEHPSSPPEPTDASVVHHQAPVSTRLREGAVHGDKARGRMGTLVHGEQRRQRTPRTPSVVLKSAHDRPRWSADDACNLPEWCIASQEQATGNSATGSGETSNSGSKSSATVKSVMGDIPAGPTSPVSSAALLASRGQTPRGASELGTASLLDSFSGAGLGMEEEGPRAGDGHSPSRKAQEQGQEWRWPQEGFYEAAKGTGTVLGTGTANSSGTWWGLGLAAKEEEYVDAYQRFAQDLHFEPSPGLDCTEISPQLVFGCGLRTPLDICYLRQQMGITAVLDLQQPSDSANWGLDPNSVHEAARQCGMPVVRRPMRRFDGQDLRLQLPPTVAALHRMLRVGHSVYLCSTEGLDRAPSVVVAYLHWVLAIPLADAVAFIQDLKPCAINRGAITAATWDAIALVDRSIWTSSALGVRPPTHTVQIVWNHGGREVLVVGECCGGWNDPVPAQPAGGSRFILDVRLPMGLYRFKFIVDGQWRHAVDMPTEVDKTGNTNNLLRVGKLPSNSPAPKVSSRERVIERPLTNEERSLLTFASQWMAFRVDPRTFEPKGKAQGWH